MREHYLELRRSRTYTAVLVVILLLESKGLYHNVYVAVYSLSQIIFVLGYSNVC